MGRVIVTFSDVIICFYFFPGTMTKAEVEIEPQQPGKYTSGHLKDILEQLQLFCTFFNTLFYTISQLENLKSIFCQYKKHLLANKNGTKSKVTKSKKILCRALIIFS